MIKSAHTFVKPLRLAVLHILDNAIDYDWSVQGFGLLRLYIRTVGRLHIWDDTLRYPNVSMIHNHSWDLRSTVVSGMLTNVRYTEETLIGRPFQTHRMITGYQCSTVTPVRDTRLLEWPREKYFAGDVYTQHAAQIHQTLAINGTVTLMERQEDENGQADIYWPANCTWGTARPRPATIEEIVRTVANATALLESGQ